MFLPSNITLQFGDTGDFVAELQRRLSLINLFNEAFINATYDSNTVNAVKSFQSMQGLRVDGVAGPETLRRLNGSVAGDSSSGSTSNQEEEQKKAQATALMIDAIFADTMQQPIDPTLTAAPAKQETREAAPAAAEKPVVPPPPPRSDMAQASQDAQMQQQMEALKQQELARQAQQPSPEELQARLQQQQAEMQRMQEQLKQQQVAKPTEQAKPTEAQKPKEEPAPERKTLSGMLQKLVDYIESKLPRSVADEVKAIGQVMARAGVREAPIASETSPAAPAVEAGRGAQQQQQRG